MGSKKQRIESVSPYKIKLKSLIIPMKIKLFPKPVQYIPIKFSVPIQTNARASHLRVMCYAKALPEKKFVWKDNTDSYKKRTVLNSFFRKGN